MTPIDHARFPEAQRDKYSDEARLSQSSAGVPERLQAATNHAILAECYRRQVEREMKP